MGNVLESVGELNPLTAVSNTVKSVCHDFNVYFLNALKSDCDLRGCWKFTFQSQETHDEPAPETPNFGITRHT